MSLPGKCPGSKLIWSSFLFIPLLFFSSIFFQFDYMMLSSSSWYSLFPSLLCLVVNLCACRSKPIGHIICAKYTYMHTLPCGKKGGREREKENEKRKQRLIPMNQPSPQERPMLHRKVMPAEEQTRRQMPKCQQRLRRRNIHLVSLNEKTLHQSHLITSLTIIPFINYLLCVPSSLPIYLPTSLTIYLIPPVPPHRFY